jgi:hypothetical protein
MLSLDPGKLLHPPLFHLAPGSFQCVLRTDGVWIELFEQIFLLLALFRSGSAPCERPGFREHLKRRAEAGEVQVDTADGSRPPPAFPFLSPRGGPFGPRSSGSMKRSMSLRHFLQASLRRRSTQDASKERRTRRADERRFTKATMAGNISACPISRLRMARMCM